MTTQEEYEAQLEKEESLEEKEELEKNILLINNFIDSYKRSIENPQFSDCSYSHPVGITANVSNIITQLDPNLSPDKEGLFEFSELLKKFTTLPFAPGMFISRDYILIADSLFRREFNYKANFAPRFIDMFWKFKDENVTKYIALDLDRVRLNDGTSYGEKDFWIGAKLNKNISEIKDGIVKLRPPLGLTESQLEIAFASVYALDIKWATSGNIKTFQAEEFKSSNKKINFNGLEYYPARYLHAEYDCLEKSFRHFDGAIHFYTEDEYFLRRDEDFNYNSKNNFKLKTLSKKLFKLNGKITVPQWEELCCQYLSKNPLMFEYFDGKIPTKIQKIIDVFLNQS